MKTNLKKNDWIGLGTSVAVHALLLFLFTFLTAAAPEQERLGFIEVDFGTFAEGRPVRQSPVETPEATVNEATEPPEDQPEASPPEESKPVDLPDQPEEVSDPDVVTTPETDAIAPETQNNEADVTDNEPTPESQPIRPLGSGSVDGTTGEQSGDQGEGTDEQESAPYQIEGLNRDPIRTVMPDYREQVEATIRIRIMVDPRGRVVQRIPLLKANPALEQAAMEALQRWQFNALPPNAPQEPQIGVVTFHFRLE